MPHQVAIGPDGSPAGESLLIRADTEARLRGAEPVACAVANPRGSHHALLVVHAAGGRPLSGDRRLSHTER